jgi:hypothetical protein
MAAYAANRRRLGARAAAAMRRFARREQRKHRNPRPAEGAEADHQVAQARPGAAWRRYVARVDRRAVLDEALPRAPRSTARRAALGGTRPLACRCA